MTRPYVTRIAPSPTGMMHVGTARTALFNWLAARAGGGKFILRIDDTDLERNREEAVRPILDGLDWLGLDRDETYRQSERSDVYARHAEGLVDAGLARRADNGAVLLLPHPDVPSTWRDRVAGDVAITADDAKRIDGLPLLRGGDKAGQATYQFASTLDDYLMGVDLVIRGTDHIPNTAKQVGLWTALSAAFGDRPVPEFAHVGLVHKDGRKLSKRDGAASLLDYRDQGTHPDAMFNFLLRLGWGPHDDGKAMTLIDRERALALFLDKGNMRSPPAGLDATKLAFYDRRYKQADFRRAREARADPAPAP